MPSPNTKIIMKRIISAFLIMKKITKKILLLTLTLILIITQTCCGVKEEQNPGVSRDSFALDTVCRITIYGMSMLEMRSTGYFGDLDEKGRYFTQYMDKLLTTCYSMIGDYENMLSKTKEGSDIYLINHANGEPVEVHDETIELLEFGIRLSELSSGVFDITIGKVIDLWDFRSEDHTGTLPDETAIAEALTHVDYKNIKIEGNTVTLLDPEAEIDLGAIAKGYIADRVMDYLYSKGTRSAIINLGGNIVALGDKFSTLYERNETTYENFKIGVNNPLAKGKKDALLYTFDDSDITVVTSGTYERYIEVDGKRYHHIINAKTGYPVENDIVQATIMAGSGYSMLCDGLSTLSLLLGPERAENILMREGIYKAIFLNSDGSTYEVF